MPIFIHSIELKLSQYDSYLYVSGRSNFDDPLSVYNPTAKIIFQNKTILLKIKKRDKQTVKVKKYFQSFTKDLKFKINDWKYKR